ncbi:MAG TPA: acyl-CoA dehydrogenase family protein [Acidimicrobiales bacterium]|nr:acyl-CoA dehydrogenase family protein [Acidimicrobiales bacterium]
MRFAPTQDDEELRAVVHRLLDAEVPASAVRAAAAAPAGHLDRSIWTAIEDMGVLDVLVPAEDGGLGLGLDALIPVLEETGRVALVEPIVESAAVAAPLLGERRPGLMCGATWGGAPVPCGLDVDAVVVVGDREVIRFERDALELEPLETVDPGRRLARLAHAGDGTVLTDDPGAVAAAFHRGALGTAAQLVGLSDRLIEQTVAYVQDRQQFSVAIGSFQAVKHHLADAAMELAFARPVVRQAAHALDRGHPDAGRQVSQAKAAANEAAELAARTALQCHGAIGYTVEHDLHLHLKRVWALRRSWGTTAWHTEQVARALDI